MARKATGELRALADGWEARVRIDDEGNRKGFALVAIGSKDEAAAKVRCTAMADIAQRLRRAGHTAQVVDLLKMAAKARVGKPWEAVVGAVDLLCGGRVTADGPAPVTVKELGQQWRSGDLHRRFRDHIGAKKESSVKRDEELSRLYVDPKIGDMAIADVDLDDVEGVMADLPEDKSASTRRLVAQYMRRLLQMAVYPLRLRTDNPVPRGWLPRVPNDKAKECLYPGEDRALLAAPRVPLLRRVCYAFLSREGMRTDEMARLDWNALDLEHGRVALDENKTDDPRDWDLDPGVWRAMKAWKERYCPNAEPTDRVFAENGVPVYVNRLPSQLRSDLKKAGVTRPKLFERSATRMPLRAHDLRSTFVTIALATGKSETFVMDRTGHTTSDMLQRYRRKARTWNLGALDPMDTAIPELAPAPQECPADVGSGPISGHHVSENDNDSTMPLQSTGTDGVLSFACNKSDACTMQELRSTSSRDVAIDAADKANSMPHAHGAMHGANEPSATIDPVEVALAAALTDASKARRFDIVAAIAKELEARRLAREPNVVSLGASRRR